MAALKRHWRETVLATAVLTLALGWLTWQTTTPASAQSEEVIPLTVAQRDDLRNTLEAVHLDRDALVALNLSPVQAGDVLSDARAWWEQNSATLVALRETIATKKHAVYVIEKAIALGPLDPEHAGQLATARQELADAQGAYDTALTGLETAVALDLSQSQQATWSAIQTGHGQRMPLRMLALSGTQRVAISRAWRHYRWRHAAAATPAERTAAVAAWNTAQSTILTPEQSAIVESYHTNFESASEAVADAIDAEMPLQDS